MKTLTFLTAILFVLGAVRALTDDWNLQVLNEKAPWLSVPQTKTADPEEFPWQVAVVSDDRFFCAGSLVSRKWVLTAAHCTANFKVFDVHIGSQQTVRQSTRTVVRHPDYNAETQANDLALLELPEQVTLSRTLDIARLPDGDIDVNAKELIVTGWSSLENKMSIWAGVSSPPLESAVFRGATSDACVESYGSNYSSKNQLCLDTSASPHFENVLLLQDGGAPIVLKQSDDKYTQVGMLSFGPGPSNLRLPAVAVKLHAYRDWIRGKTGQ